MAYGLRYTFNFLSDNGKDVVINISEDGYSGTSLLRNVGGSPQLRLEQGDCIKGMSLEIPAECVVEDEYADLYTSDPYKYLVELEVDSSPVWKGFITPELYSAPWIDPPYDVLLTATDGLGELKMHNYPALGRQRLEALFSTLLGATGLNLPLKMISTAENDVAESTYVLADSSVNLDALAGETYYDVLQKLLTSLHATVQQKNGAWLLIRETDINSMTSGDYVLDTAGAPYEITDFGSMNDYDVWPVGQLRMEIVPAKNRVQVSAANDLVESLLPDPDLERGDWQTDGTHYTSDGGFYALARTKRMYYDFIPETQDVNSYPDYFDWKFKFRQSGTGEASFKYAIWAYGIDRETNQETQLCWVESDASYIGYWASGGFWMTQDVDRARYGNSSDCAEHTVRIKMFGSLTSRLSRIDRIEFFILSNIDTIYIHYSSVSASSLIEGVNTTLILNNNARGAGDTVEPVFADTYIGNHGRTFMWNAVQGHHGQSTWLVDTWNSDIIPALPYGEWLAKDNALSLANPRLRLQGKLNVVDYIPSLFYRTQEIAYVAEEWDFDLLKDEADISLISMPATAIQVTSVRQTAFNEEGEAVDSAVTVLPSSFTIAAGDSTTRFYIAISAPAGLAWMVTGVPEWIYMSDSDKSGTGSDTISFLGTVNAGAARQAIILVAGMPVNIYQEGIGTDYPLTISVSPSDATLALTIGGEAATYTQGMLVPSGTTVGVTVSKTGYGTVTDSFTMPSQVTSKTYTLVESVEATISQPAKISYSAQNVSFTVSDPSNHGWLLDYSGFSGDSIDGSGVTSGSATAHTDYIDGTGNAVVYVHVTENTGQNERTIWNTSNNPFYFFDETTHTRTGITISQLGTNGSVTNVTSVSLNKNSTTLSVGDQETLEATVLPNNATNKNLSWYTSDPSVASVSQSGEITAVSAGSCTIAANATDGSGKRATCSVTVTGQNIPVNGVTLDKASLVISRGSTYTLTATIQPPGASNQNVTWDAADPRIATVSSSGLVTAVALGTTTVTVTTADGGYTAQCSVTVTATGSMSAENVTVKSVATSAATKLTAQNMDLSSITVSENVSWITVPEDPIDTSGNPYRVRLNLNENTSSSGRSATVTLTGTDEDNNPVTATFTVTQNGRTSSDVPCTSMSIDGSDTIANSDNEATYGAGYQPARTTQAQCVWSITSGSSYVTMTTNGSRCTLTVKPGTTNQTVVLKAKNYYSSVYATKTITVTYVAPAAELTASPASVTVQATDTSDNSPVVTATNIQSGSLQVYATTGFITSASVSGGRLATSFSANTGSTTRDGSVTLRALKQDGVTPVTAVVNYTQAGRQATRSVSISKLNVAQTGGKVTAKILVGYSNQLSDATTFGSQTYTLKGYDSSNEETINRTGNLPDKVCAGVSIETELYEEQWIAVLGATVRYELTLWSGGLTATYQGDGNDVID